MVYHTNIYILSNEVAFILVSVCPAGGMIDSVIVLLLKSGVRLLHGMPLEAELVESISAVILALSLSRRTDRLRAIVADSSLQEIVKVLSSPYDDSVCRLNCEGLSSCCFAVACLLVRSGSKQLFVQVKHE